MYLELSEFGADEPVLEVFYSDKSGEFSLTCFKEAVPLAVVEWLIERSSFCLLPILTMVKLATTDADIGRCFAVMRQLRPHLTDEAEFVARARRQLAEQNWHLAYVEDDAGTVAACAGFRLLECLSSGRTLYVDDLVTDESRRSKGFGGILLRWLEDHARAQGCETFSLDSATHRTGAHKFYYRMGLPIFAFHFARKL
jgi:GNAT superfamily N-acetyltransferase